MDQSAYNNSTTVLSSKTVSSADATIYAKYCQNCASVTNGSCSLTTPSGVCTYTTSCNTGYKHKSGQNTRSPVCVPKCKTGEDTLSNGQCRKYTTGSYVCTAGDWDLSDSFTSTGSCSPSSKPDNPSDGSTYTVCVDPAYKQYCAGESSSAVSGRWYSASSGGYCSKYCGTKACYNVTGVGIKKYTYSCTDSEFVCPSGYTKSGTTCYADYTPS